MMQTEKGKAAKFFIFLVGLCFGGLIVGSYFLFFNRETKKESTVVSSETKGIVLSVSSPENGTVTDKSKINLIGSTGKNSVVVITGGVADTILQTSEGKFSKDIELSEGQNQITIYAFDTSTGENAQTAINILYISDTLSGNNQEKASTVSTQLRKDRSLPRSYTFGTIVSKNDSLISIDTLYGLKTLILDDLTKFLIVGEKGVSKATLENLKIGDVISAAGLSTEDAIGKTKYVIKTEKVKTKHYAVLGKVKEINGPNLILESIGLSGKIFDIKVSKDTQLYFSVPEFTSLENIGVGDLIVASGTLHNTGQLFSTTVLAIPSPKSDQKQKESSPSASSNPKQ